MSKKSIEEIRAMNRVRRNRYYERHKEEEKAKNLKRYHKKKKELSTANEPFSSKHWTLTGSMDG
jgi:hypothetical protein